MAQFDNRDVVFDVPEGWRDRSIVVIEAPRMPGSAFTTNITLMRVEGRAESTAAFAMQQVADLSGALPRFELLSQKNVSLGGLPAIELLFQWTPPDGPIVQRITVFQRQGTFWSLTASARKGEWEKLVPDFDRVASSLRFQGA